jgi:hypothetical protein
LHNSNSGQISAVVYPEKHKINAYSGG